MIEKTYQRPSFLVDLSQDTYEKWLQRKTNSLVK